nr:MULTISPECIES: DUF1403 family protein [unclassified Mesorhizobium]
MRKLCFLPRRAGRCAPSISRRGSNAARDRLLAVAPKLRAKGADTVNGRLLNDDALVFDAAIGAGCRTRSSRVTDETMSGSTKGTLAKASMASTFRQLRGTASENVQSARRATALPFAAATPKACTLKA